MSRHYFGTDGIRGRVGENPITPDFMLKLGWASGRVFKRLTNDSGQPCTVVIGKDTRISGYMFESALESGLVAAGVNVCLLGPMPTPAIALVTITQRAVAGIVISASHNPYFDNGIKFFNADGRKLPDEIELAIETELDQPISTVDSADLGKVWRLDDAGGRYIEYCKSTVPHKFSLRGCKVVVDCAHGASYQVAPSVLRELGADVVVTGAEPDGFNINQDVGSTSPALLQQRVIEEKADVGIALDGDGDRVLFVDHEGRAVDGDELLYVIARDKQVEGVVGTQMSNLGVELALKEIGIDFARAKVGDRFVNELMRQHEWVIGGESSGHIICSELSSTGDGLVAALQVLLAMKNAGSGLAQLTADIKKFPQHVINVKCSHRDKLVADNAELQAAVAAMEVQLGECGRVLLRSSGTEPLIRVMVEGEHAQQVEELCAQLAERVADLL